MGIIKIVKSFFKKEKPIFQLLPLETQEGEIVLRRNIKTGEFEVPVKKLSSEAVEFVKFKNWEEVKNLFDKKSQKVIERSLKVFLRKR